MDGLTEGRIVHFVMPNGEHRPAIIVRVWDKREPDGSINLQVFTDGRNDAQYFSNQDQIDEVAGGTFWKASIQFDEDTKPIGTWHWIEKA